MTAHAKVKKVKLAGEGGVEWTFDLPLSETLNEQLVSGALHPVDNESAALVDDYLNELEGYEEEELVDEASSSTAEQLAERLGVSLDELEVALAATKQPAEAEGGSGDGPRFYDEQTSREAELLSVTIDECEADDDGDVMEDNVREAFFGRVTKRADLNEAAEKIGVAEPGKLDNIDAVKAAITDRLDAIEAEAEGGSGDE